MMDSLANCFNRIQERYVSEAKPIYRDDLDITSPLNDSTKKSRCLERAKRIDKSLRFEIEKEDDEQKTEPVKLPRKVVRFQLENNKFIEPKKTLRFDLDHELEPKAQSMEEKEGGKEEIVRIKIKMTKKEAKRLLSKCKNDCVLDFEHLVDQIVHVPAHQVQVAVVVVAFNDR